jgi:tRNA-specific adenosine deaminase 2
MSEDEKETHLKFMREALNMVPFNHSKALSRTDIYIQAELALRSDETPVGCIFVHNGNIIGRGMNATNRTYNGTRHAEFIAINDILASNPSSPGNEDKKYSPDILKECDLYVTVEPCIMCASLLRQFGVRRVFFGTSNEKFGGTGGVLNVHRSNGFEEVEESESMSEVEREKRRKRKEGDYEVSGGWLREEAIVILRRFYVQANGRAPEPRNKKERVLKLEVEPVIEGLKDGIK